VGPRVHFRVPVEAARLVRVRDAAALETLERYEADLFLLDAYSAKARDGRAVRSGAGENGEGA
jgi:hypothetical protein